MTKLDVRNRRLDWLAAALVLAGAGWGSNEFTPLLPVYQRALGVGPSGLAVLFGVYAVGLIVGLVVAGPLSDARGRRGVVLAGAMLSVLGGVLMVVGSSTVGVLGAGRTVTGLANGFAFGAGTVWLRELSAAADPEVPVERLARRVVVAMTAGFAVGPLVAAVLAQWVPASRILPYVPQIALMAAAGALAARVPALHHQGGPVVLRTGLPSGPTRKRWWGLVVPVAPWVFAAPAVAFGFLPTAVGVSSVTDGVLLTGVVTAAVALAGVLVQPLASRMMRVPGTAPRARLRPGTLGLLVLAAGLILGTLTLQAHAVWVLFPAGIVLGAGYGLCLVDGLVEVQRIADPATLGALTSTYYVFTYFGFGAPYLLTALSPLAGYPALLLVGAGLAAATAVLVNRAMRLPRAGRRGRTGHAARDPLPRPDLPRTTARTHA